MLVMSDDYNIFNIFEVDEFGFSSGPQREMFYQMYVNKIIYYKVIYLVLPQKF